LNYNRGPVKWLDWLTLNEGPLTIASVSSSYEDSFPCLQGKNSFTFSIAYIFVVWESDLSGFES
jgi:hypothetical protein